MRRTFITLSVVVAALLALTLMNAKQNNPSHNTVTASGVNPIADSKPMDFGNLLGEIVPTGRCQDRDPWAKCITKCAGESELVYAYCMVVYNDQPKCAGQAHDYEAACQQKGGCPD